MIVTDSFGRAWRQGTTDVAIGVAGMSPLVDLRGHSDHRGRPLEATLIAVADELAGAAELVMGKAARVPAALRAGAGPGAVASIVRARVSRYTVRMRRRGSSHVAVLGSFAVLIGGLLQGSIVLCVGSDGHVAVESSVPGDPHARCPEPVEPAAESPGAGTGRSTRRSGAPGFSSTIAFMHAGVLRQGP